MTSPDCLVLKPGPVLQDRPAVAVQSNSVEPWDALSVASSLPSDFPGHEEHARCAHSASAFSRLGHPGHSSGASLDGRFEEGFPSRMQLRTSLLQPGVREFDFNKACGDVFGKVSDGGTAALELPRETPIMRADDRGQIVNLKNPCFADDRRCALRANSRCIYRSRQIPCVSVSGTNVFCRTRAATAKGRGLARKA